jgi:hypothetical protein
MKSPLSRDLCGRVHVYRSTELDIGEGWKLCLQLVHYPNGYDGYRLIHKDPAGRMRSARGQTSIQNKTQLDTLWASAKAEGWGDFDLTKGKLAVKIRKVTMQDVAFEASA